MLQNASTLFRQLAAAGAVGFTALVLAKPARSQTLPVAGNPQQTAAQDRADRRSAQDRDAIRGAREQDEAAQRTASRLNRDTRQEARQRLDQAAGFDEQNFGARPNAQSQSRTRGPANTGLRAADLGIWLTTRPGANGLIVADLARQGAFAQAGFQEGDRIVSINGQPATTEAQLVQSLVTPLARAQTANFVIDRNGQQQTLTVQPSAVVQNIVSSDPLYQTGFLLDDRGPGRLVVERVFPRTAAFYAGLQPGDVITTVNGQPITTLDSLTQLLESGGPANVLVTRNGQTRQLSLITGDNALLRTAMRPGVANPPTGSNVGPLGSSSQVVPTVPSGAIQQSEILAPSAPGVAPVIPSGALPPSPGLAPSAPGVAPATPSGALPAGTGTGITSGGAAVNPLTGSAASPSTRSPATPAVQAVGSPSARGATGTIGGAGSTAGGTGAVGGTGAIQGGTGSTAGPAGGSGAGAAGGAGSGRAGGT